MALHPAFVAYLDELNAVVAKNRAAGLQPTVAGAREALASLNKFAAPAEPIASVFDTQIFYQSESGEVEVPLRVYVPRPDETSDVILFVHGGGHMAGDIDVYDFSARRTAAATGMVVVSVDYRRSPETAFPGGLVDTYEVLNRLDEVLVDVAHSTQVHAVADSGGGAKLASIAMRVAEGPWVSPIKRQVLLYPSLDYTLSGATVRELARGYFLETDRVEWYFDNYLPAGTDRRAVSPLYGPISADHPETLVIAAEYDPLRSEAESYVARLVAAGVRAKLINVPAMIHAYLFFESLVPDEVARTYEVIAEFLTTGDANWD
ncbi:MAG: alpha/beta hydrolase [Acidimicrobiales bacterium]|nr:alpha/beta hydrolase [Acidimicrobiales bacterium]